MDLNNQLSEQRILASVKARQVFGLLYGGILELTGSPKGFVFRFGDVVCLGVAATFLLISILARSAAVISDTLLAASRVVFDLIEALPGLPHIALTARLLLAPAPAPAATRR